MGLYTCGSSSRPSGDSSLVPCGARRHKHEDLTSGSKAQTTGESRNHGLQDPHVYVGFWVPSWMTICYRGPQGLTIAILGRKTLPYV